MKLLFSKVLYSNIPQNCFLALELVNIRQPYFYCNILQLSGQLWVPFKQMQLIFPCIASIYII